MFPTGTTWIEGFKLVTNLKETKEAKCNYLKLSVIVFLSALLSPPSLLFQNCYNIVKFLKKVILLFNLGADFSLELHCSCNSPYKALVSGLTTL